MIRSGDGSLPSVASGAHARKCVPLAGVAVGPHLGRRSRRTVWRAGNALIGQFGNKLVVVAERAAR